MTTAGLLRLFRQSQPTSEADGHADPACGLDASRPVDLPPVDPAISVSGRIDPKLSGDIQVDSTQSLELIEEVRDHMALLSNLLEPLCNGQQETLHTGQRKGIWHYLSEVERLLSVLIPKSSTWRR